MKYLLDSNIIIALISGAYPGVVRRAAECYEGDLVTSAIAYAEVAYGSRRGLRPSEADLQAFRDEVPVLDFNLKAATAYTLLPFKRASYDRLIGAHALSLGLIVVTHNVAHFQDIGALAVENWIGSA